MGRKHKDKGPTNGRNYNRTVAPTKTMKKRTYRKNRHKHNHNYYCMTYSLDNHLSVCNEFSCNKFNNKHDNNQELVILSKQTLTQAQKNVLRDYPLYLNLKNLTSTSCMT